MELIEFEFKKERKVGEFVQDFISLLKMIFPHLFGVMFSLLLLPICAILLLSYYISLQLNFNMSYQTIGEQSLLFMFFMAVVLLILIGMLSFGFTMEYFILLRDRLKLDFGVPQVWKAFWTNIGKYFKFLFAAIIVSIILAVPILVCMGVALFIPFVGSFAVGVLYSIIGLYFFIAFMLYREGYKDLTDSFGASYTLIKKKILDYGVASYLVSFIFQSLLFLITMIPSIIIGLIAFNYVGYSLAFFDTLVGKVLVMMGGTILALFSIVYYMLAVISYGLIYETAKELHFGESIFNRISNIGGEGDA